MKFMSLLLKRSCSFYFVTLFKELNNNILIYAYLKQTLWTGYTSLLEYYSIILLWFVFNYKF